MNIHRRDFVLEIGSGHNPKPRADVLCDKFIDDDRQRGGHIVADRPLVEADGQHLPFADSAFDYVICSHVLEHIEDPVLLIHELMRVAKRGYIETPSEIAERIYGWPYHHWLINRIGTKLVLQKKRHTSQFGQLFHTLVAHDKQWKRFHLTHHHLFLVQHEWDGNIEYEIIQNGKSPMNLDCHKTVESLIAKAEPNLNLWMPILKNAIPAGVVSKAKSFLAKRYKRRQTKTLTEILVCPQCKTTLNWAEGTLHCKACTQQYPIINGIPRLTLAV